MNADYTIIIVDYIYIFKAIEVKKIIIKISIYSLRSKIYYFNKFIILIFYIKGVLLDSIYIFI